MSINELFSTLISNVIEYLPEIQIVAIVDRDGLVITSQSKNANDDDILGTVTAVFDTLIGRIKKEYGTAEKFNNVISVDNNKFLFSSAGIKAIFTLLVDKSVDDKELKVIGEHISQKVDLILQEKEVDLNIPPIIKVLSNMRNGALPSGEFTAKIIILGDHSVGKTSLIRRFVDNKFHDSYISTIGVDISRKESKLSTECLVNLSLWDIAGQYRNVKSAPHTKRFYFGADLCIIVFDLSRKETFDHIDEWISLTEEFTKKRIPLILVGNKSDLPNSQVTENEIQQKAKELNTTYIITSAKTGNNVLFAFEYAGYKYCEKI